MQSKTKYYEEKETKYIEAKCNVCNKKRDFAEVDEKKEYTRGRPRKKAHWICNSCKRKIKRKELWEKVKGFMQASRIQTAPFAAAVIYMAYLSGLDKQMWLNIILPFLGGLVHMVGCIHNSIIDTVMGYDTKDSNKVHGYTTGVLDAKKHKKMINWIILVFAVILSIIGFFGANNILSLLGIIFLVVGGYVYNNISKQTYFGFIPIGVSYAGMVLYGFSLSHSTVLLIDLFPLIIYVMAVTMIQIAFWGELKDIEYDEKSLVKKLGVKLVNNYLTITKKFDIMYFTFRALSLSPLIVYMVLTHDPNHIIQTVHLSFWMFVFVLIAFWLNTKIFQFKEWNRRKIFLYINFSEFLFIFLMFPFFIKWWMVFVILPVSVGLWIGLNKLLWDDYVQKT
ncbi:MAG: hypothetical protein HZR80_20140 [Candidatus Heimdallarchaeota archaeon]